MAARVRARHWSKTEILTAYLNTIYFGNGAYGVADGVEGVLRPQREDADARRGGAARRHPGGSVALGSGGAPARGAARRRDGAPARCSSRGTSPHADFVRANSAPLPKPEDVRLPASQSPKAPYFTNYVKQQLVDRYGSATVFGGGLRVRTSIDLRVQQAARDAIAKWLDRPGAPVGGARRDRPARTAACSRWSAATTTASRSSTSPCRASGSRARRSSRSCSRPRSRKASRRARRSSRSRSRCILDGTTLARAQLRGLVPRHDRPRSRRRSTPTTASTRS